MYNERKYKKLSYEFNLWLINGETSIIFLLLMVNYYIWNVQYKPL